MKKILITGFEAFDNSEKNPTADWINWMKERVAPSGLEIQGIILPVTFNGAFLAFKKIYDEFLPDLIILTGLAQNRKELTVERIGINWIDARIPDNDGVQLRAQKIENNGPDGLFTTVDINELISLVEKTGSTMKISTSAGEYVCNELLYRVLYYTKNKQKTTQTTFIHIPGLDSYESTYTALENVVYNI